MFYKPAYCCSCGEEIERIDWNILTSRRFCEFCETEHKLEDWLRNFAAAGLLLFGAVGIGSYFTERERTFEIRGPRNSALNGNQIPNNEGGGRENANPEVSADDQGASKSDSAQKPQGSPAPDNAGDTGAVVSPGKKPQKLATSPVYFCGAVTRKGTPCSRKVKNGGRCWQHEGKDAALPKEKLLVRD